MRRGTRPYWTTAIVLVGTVASVGLFLLLGGRTPAELLEAVGIGGSSSTPAPSPAPPAEPTAASPVPPTTSSPGTSRPSPVPTGPSSPSPSPRPTSPEPSPTAPATPAVVRAPLDVLNQTTRPGLAARAAAALSELGWSVARVDNAAFGAARTTVYVPEDLQPAAAYLQAVAPEITRSRPAFEGLSATSMTIVLAEPDAESVVEALEADAAALAG